MRTSNNKEYRDKINTLLQEDQQKNPSAEEVERLTRVTLVLIREYKQRYGQFPTALEFTNENMLPTARFIQRRLGGLRRLRKNAGFTVTDYSAGKERATTAKKANKRAYQYEHELFTKLYKKFHDPENNFVVEREPVISEFNPESNNYGYKRADVAIHDYRNNSRTTQYVDFFFPTHIESLKGCVRAKNKKINGHVPAGDITFVCTNPRFSQSDIDNANFPDGSPRVMSTKTFAEVYLK